MEHFKGLRRSNKQKLALTHRATFKSWPEAGLRLILKEESQGLKGKFQNLPNLQLKISVNNDQSKLLKRPELENCRFHV